MAVSDDKNRRKYNSYEVMSLVFKYHLPPVDSVSYSRVAQCSDFMSNVALHSNLACSRDGASIHNKKIVVCT